jgi:hypothetical protein
LCRQKSVVADSAAHTKFPQPIHSVSAIKAILFQKGKFTVRGIIIKGQQGYIAPTRPESNQKLATIINKGIKCKYIKVCSKISNQQFNIIFA